MEEQRRAVLERVARGDLSPADAAALLDDMERKTSGDEGPAPPHDPRDWAADWAREPGWPTPPSAPPSGDRAARVRVVRTVGTADIIGDPTVVEAVAEGPHVARREGDTIVVEGQDDGVEVPGFAFHWHGRSRPVRHRSRLRMGDVMPLRVRVNPDLPLEVEAQAGKLRIRGVHAPIRATVLAGSTDIVDFRSPVDLTVQAGSVVARGRLDQGSSHIRCDAGSVRLMLERGSSVRISAHTTLGKVVFDGHEGSPWIVGSGDGTLDIDGTMGSVRVMAD